MFSYKEFLSLSWAGERCQVQVCRHRSPVPCWSTLPVFGNQTLHCRRYGEAKMAGKGPGLALVCSTPQQLLCCPGAWEVLCQCLPLPTDLTAQGQHTVSSSWKLKKYIYNFSVWFFKYKNLYFNTCTTSYFQILCVTQPVYIWFL